MNFDEIDVGKNFEYQEVWIFAKEALCIVVLTLAVATVENVGIGLFTIK